MSRLPRTVLCCAALGTVLVLGLVAYQYYPNDPARPFSETAPPWFKDITDEAGINFVHDAGPTGAYFMPQSIGSGAALFDFDNDGRLDIYLLQNAGPDSRSTNRLFHQRADGTFEDVTAGSGLDIAGYNMGVAVGDVNNDGLPDVLVTQYTGIKLFLNKGDGKFTDITVSAGLDNPFWATSAAFTDYDRDGWLDLVVVNYVDYDPSFACPDAQGKPEFCAPQPFPGCATRLFRNCGKPGGDANPPVRFEDVTVRSHLARFPGPGLGVVCADFNGDHWPDIFVANDAKPNHLWINQKDGTFKEEGALRGVGVDGTGQRRANMGIALADVDGDGLLDLFVTHVAREQHTLWRQGPPGLFQDRTAAEGLTRRRWAGTGFGTVLADFNLDGAPDLAIVNGHIERISEATPDTAVVRALGPFWSRYAQRSQLFENDGTGQFRDHSLDAEPFCAQPAVARGLAWGDINSDGAVDLLVTTIAGPARLYRNIAPRAGHWLVVRALDPELRRDAYGAEIRIRAGSKSWLGLVNPGSSFLCSNDPRVHFGLGPAERVDAIHIVWPDGVEEAFPAQVVDQMVVLRKGTGQTTRPGGPETP